MIAIRTPDQRLRIFVSSTMKELASERVAARAAIERLRLIPVLFELGARPYPPRDLYLAYLRQSDVFVGIYGQQYGWIAPDQKVSGLEDEYLNAGGMPKLVYVQSPAPDRDPRLSEMLTRIQSDGLSYRGFATSDELSTLIADDLAVLLSERFDLRAEPSVAGRPSRPLPTPASRFIGREREKSLVRDLLTGGDTRLVTLVGAGGIGKTRLALEVGTSLIGTFDRVVMVALDEVSSADLVVSSIASSLGVPESPGQSLLDLVINSLRNRRTLLIIDNFEHVMDAAAVLGQLITDTDQAKLLVTSRERLRLSGERVVDVPSLQVPGAADNEEVLRRSDAVELFIDRARAAGRNLSPARRNPAGDRAGRVADQSGGPAGTSPQARPRPELPDRRPSRSSAAAADITLNHRLESRSPQRLRTSAVCQARCVCRGLLVGGSGERVRR
jgi:Domain of unknown function (DUF4062)/NB-ARC domain